MNHFNEFFISGASKLVQDLPLSSSLSYPQFKTSPCSSQNSLYIFPTTPHEINKIISEIKPKKSSGLNEIPTFLLHKLPPNILIALSHSFNLSIAQGVYLDVFKTAKVIPIFKKGSALDVNNYRPISLLPALSKIFEKIMHRRLYSFLTKNIISFTSYSLDSEKNTPQTMQQQLSSNTFAMPVKARNLQLVSSKI